MVSQEQAILEYLKSGYSLTPLEALEKFKCFRLASRISSLKQMGHNIKTETVHNNGKHWARYFLETKLVPVGKQEQYVLI